MSQIDPITDAALEELRRLHTEANGSPRDYSAPVLRSALRLYEQFPALDARLQQAERERDELREDYRRLEAIRRDLMKRCEVMKSLDGLSLDEIAAR